MKRYKEYTITAEPFNTEIISSILWELEIEGLYEDVNCIHVYATEKSTVSIDLVKEELEKIKAQNLLHNYSVEENILTDRNWNMEWEASISIIKISDRIVIKPTFREYKPKKNEIVITIDPKMSFGTGEHQTTKLVLQLLEKYTAAGQKVLDIGSGTGVLAIAALKLGAASAVAVDNDEWCLNNGMENAALNNVEDKLSVKLGVLKDIAEKDFDLITANIQRNILLDIADDISLKA
ncbi:MAG: 50S ribosomal protein L11 methyltransferase, partial [Ignavibacteriaceae bacterium]